jgi:hypothetical protein
MENKAKYQISSSVNNGILEIVLTGEESERTSENMKNDIDNVIIKNNVKYVMIDVRVLKGRLGISETYMRVRNYHTNIHKFHITIVDLPENAHYQEFHETTAQNAGRSYKCFTDMDAARDWLKNKQEEEKNSKFKLP